MLYDTNKDFREYVDRYAAHYQSGGTISVTEALSHMVVKEVANFYINNH